MRVNNLNIALVPNVSKENVVFYTKKIIQLFLSFNVNVMTLEKNREFFEDFNCEFLRKDLLYKNCDVIVAIGGDGTLIHAAAFACVYEKPIVGVNLGRLGFVTEIEKNELYRLSKIVYKDYKIEKRMMLDVTVENGTNAKKVYSALNDIVISAEKICSLIDINLSFENTNHLKFRSDGIIIATPTGSTAYSLSAGGPIIDPCMNCLLVTPVCSHSLFSRPMIFNEDDVLKFSFKTKNKSNIYLSVDGNGFPLDENCALKIKKSSKYLKLISFNDYSFYDRIINKLVQRKI